MSGPCPCNGGCHNALDVAERLSQAVALRINTDEIDQLNREFTAKYRATRTALSKEEK